MHKNGSVRKSHPLYEPGLLSGVVLHEKGRREGNERRKLQRRRPQRCLVCSMTYPRLQIENYGYDQTLLLRDQKVARISDKGLALT